jgi:hypothetical protein
MNCCMCSAVEYDAVLVGSQILMLWDNVASFWESTENSTLEGGDNELHLNIKSQ